jgi:hypothetical protein
MPTQVTANDGDCLCIIAIENGFLNCQPLRDEPANAALLNRPLQRGDVVTVPDIKLASVDKPTDARHSFVKKSSPPVSIRFVHGSPDRHYLDDLTSAVLNISNFVTTQAGNNGQQPFPSQPEFQQAGHDDPDTFKVEVVDPAAGGSVKVVLEAMRPVYLLDPSSGKLNVSKLDPFEGAAHTDRSLEVNCPKVRSGVAYRSPYLRLVVDEKSADPHKGDKQAVLKQTLLVSDLADGLGTGQPDDNDTLEILDQQVRATYTIARCPAPATNQCSVHVQVPIGEDERRRLRLAFHIFRTSVGGTPVGAAVGESASQAEDRLRQSARFRTFKWLRRVYAQVNIAPKLVDPLVEFLDPPPANMIVISGDGSGAMPTGQSRSATPRFPNGASSLSFTLSSPDGSFADVNVLLNLNDVMRPAPPAQGAQTPVDIANAISAILDPAFLPSIEENPPATGAAHGSCDVTFLRLDEARVLIRGEVVDDQNNAFTVTVPRVVGAADPRTPSLGLTLNVHAPQAAGFFANPEIRRLIRAAPGRDDQMDVYVVDFILGADENPNARGITPIRGRAAGSTFEARSPIRNCCFLGRAPDPSNRKDMNQAHAALDLTDLNFNTLPHETGHVLGDFGHALPSQSFHDLTDLMGVKGARDFNEVRANKRIPDAPVLVLMGTNTGNQTINVADTMRTEGTGLLELW